MNAPHYDYESAHAGLVCGVDEAGRGPLAGDVYAAAVILGGNAIPSGLNDSKKLSPAKREALAEELTASAQIGVGIATVAEIDQLNILHATMLAMQRAVLALPTPPAHALIDGNRIPPHLPCSAEAIVKGDAISLSIAAASIIAKTRRDGAMRALHSEYPDYGFDRHAGYGTAQHKAALQRLGVTPHHRRSFKPVRDVLVCGV